MMSKNRPGASMAPQIRKDFLSDPQYLLAQQLMQSGSDTSPVTTPIGGVARALTGALGGWRAGKTKREYQKQSDEYSAALKDLIANREGKTPDELATAMAASPNQYIRDMGQEAYGTMFAEQLKPKDPIKLGEGDILIDPTTRKELARGLPKQHRNTSFTINKDGTITYNDGVGGGANLTKPVTNKIQEKLFDSTEALGRIDAIQSAYKPEYLQLGTRTGMAVSSLQDFAGKKLSPDETQKLTAFTQFRQNAVNNINNVIKEQTGATMGVQEADRIMAGAPNAGTGLFDGDGPTTFKAKMDNTTKLLKNSVIRYNYALSHGLNPLQTGVELHKVPDLINKRGDEIKAELQQQNPGISEEELTKRTRIQLGQEFGM